jgi:hypothetical protein
MKQKTLPAITGIIIVIMAGMGVILLGIFNFKNISDMKKNGIKTEAVIIKEQSDSVRTGEIRSTHYSAQVKFTTNEGDEKIVWHRHNGNISRLDINKVVLIYYDPNNPDKIMWDWERGNNAYLLVSDFFSHLEFWLSGKRKNKPG